MIYQPDLFVLLNMYVTNVCVILFNQPSDVSFPWRRGNEFAQLTLLFKNTSLIQNFGTHFKLPLYLATVYHPQECLSPILCIRFLHLQRKKQHILKLYKQMFTEKKKQNPHIYLSSKFPKKLNTPYCSHHSFVLHQQFFILSVSFPLWTIIMNEQDFTGTTCFN